VVSGAEVSGTVVAELGQLTIRFEADAAVLQGPPGHGEPVDLPADAEAVRAFTRFDAAGRYRPLPGARSLRGGWSARFATLDELDRAIGAVYPLAQAHMAAWEEGRLRIAGLDDVLGRQTGRYASAAGLTERGRSAASAVLCGACVKAPAWAGTLPAPGQIPCPEPCSVLVSLCREAAAWEREAPARAAPDCSVPFAAFEEPGNEVREACLAMLEGMT
jgi:hypothetical protein